MTFSRHLRAARALPALGALTLALAAGMPGCTDDTPVSTTAPVQSCTGGETRAFLISTLGFTRVDPATGLTPGFDVDGLVSTGDDEESCFKKDFTSPEGEVGIDNQLAALIPDVEKIFGDAVDGLVQSAINNGELLIVFEVSGVDDIQNDDCVDVSVRTVLGNPILGTDGIIEAYQTYDEDPTSEVSRGTAGKIIDGELTIGPFELAIPLAIFDVAFTVHVHEARLRAQVSAPDGVLKQGILGGGVVPQEIIDGVEPGAGVDKYIPALTLVLKGSTDLAPDEEGTCQRISAALAVTVVEAFLRE